MASPAVNRVIARIAARLEPRLRQAFERAVAQLQASISLDAIAYAIERGDIPPEILARLADFPARLAPIGDVIARTYEQAGLSASAHLGSVLDTTVAFNLTNPRAVTWAATEAGALIRQVDQTTIDGVRAVIARAFTEGMPPRESAKLIRGLVGLTDRQDMAVITYRFDLLEQGRSADDVARLAERYAGKLHRQRALLIARTETAKAAGMGQQEAWQQAVEDGLLDGERSVKVWKVSGRENCDVCRDELKDQRVGLLESFTCSLGSFVSNPAHPACTCGVLIVPA